jgi:nucleoside-diphosphate kinase
MEQKTLVLFKPDAVRRSLIGRVLQRFEDAGLKIIAMKMVWPDRTLALKLYDEDLEKRKGKAVREMMAKFLVEQGPIIAMVLEGISAIEVVRKLVGGTEPKTALPGTIRGDFAHLSYEHADRVKKGIPNLIHASGSQAEAEKEIKIWFKPNEIHDYRLSHEEFTR